MSVWKRMEGGKARKSMQRILDDIEYGLLRDEPLAAGQDIEVARRGVAYCQKYGLLGSDEMREYEQILDELEDRQRKMRKEWEARGETRDFWV